MSFMSCILLTSNSDSPRFVEVLKQAGVMLLRRGRCTVGLNTSVTGKWLDLNGALQ